MIACDKFHSLATDSISKNLRHIHPEVPRTLCRFLDYSGRVFGPHSLLTHLLQVGSPISTLVDSQLDKINKTWRHDGTQHHSDRYHRRYPSSPAFTSSAALLYRTIGSIGRGQRPPFRH